MTPLPKYALFPAKCYQGSDSYFHRYARIYAEEVIGHYFLELMDGINMILDK